MTKSLAEFRAWFEGFTDGKAMLTETDQKKVRDKLNIVEAEPSLDPMAGLYPRTGTRIAERMRASEGVDAGSQIAADSQAVEDEILRSMKQGLPGMRARQRPDA